MFLPPPPKDADVKTVRGVLVTCALPVLTRSFRTPEPEWAKKYNVPGEAQLAEKTQGLKQKVEEVQSELDLLESERQFLVQYRALLYEQGRPLEDAVIRAFELIGFTGGRVQEDDIEHDIVMNSPEGVMVAEVEGKDDDAIHVEKLDQLSRVVDEYFAQHEEYPEGVLIGNPYRLKPPNERRDPFTKKTRKAAKRKGFGLLTTVELFKTVLRVLENPADDNFKAGCRRAILGAKGELIGFPL